VEWLLSPARARLLPGCCLPPLSGYSALHHHQLSCYCHHLSDYSLPGNKEFVVFLKMKTVSKLGS
jgi:hypothetical protein